MTNLRAAVRLPLAVILGMGLGLGSAGAQEKKITRKEVPAAVLASFEKAYSKAQIVGYAAEVENGKTYYELESKEGAVSRDILYNPDGSVVEVEESIPPDQLPGAIRQAIVKESAKGTIQKSEKVTRGSTVGYEVVVRDGQKRISLELDATGKVLKRAAR